MLIGYYVKNYKAFKETDIDIRPLTLLLGPNNTGKTCLTEVLLMMQQTAIATSAGYSAPLRINGRIVSLGAPEHLFHNLQTSKPLIFGFRFSSQGLINDFKNEQNRIGREIYSIYRDVLKYYEHIYHKRPEFLKDKKSPTPKELYVRFISPRNISEPAKINEMLKIIATIRKYILVLSSQQQKSEISEELFLSNRYFRDDISSLDSSAPDLDMTTTFVEAIGNLDNKDFTIEFEFKYSEQKPKIRLSRFCLIHEKLKLVEVGLDPSKKTINTLNSDIIPNDGRLKNYRISLAKLMTFDSTIFSQFDSNVSRNRKHLITIAIADALQSSLVHLMRCFTAQKLTHVSPIRAYPKRFYFSDQASTDQLEGDNYIEALRDNKELKDKANEWLSHFGIQITVEQVREVLHRAAITQEGVDIDLDILDVGFGVSQVLPVLIQAFLVPNNGVSIIEQPEIHLHPSMQADLLDFFIDVLQPHTDITKNMPGAFIIETHSAALLRRLRTRLAQKYDQLTSSVVIYNVERIEKGVSNANHVKINSKGSFTWPKQFLETELADTLEFLSTSTRKEI